MPILGVDVSEFQGRPDWPAVAASGVVFAFARVSFGTSKTDDSYAYNRPRIPAAGIVPGAYHYLTETSPATSQADHFCQLADPNAIHALDVEANAALDVPGWIARYRTHYPAKPLLMYTGRDLWARATSGRNGASYGQLWVAGYQPNLYVPGGGSIGHLWGEVGGHNGGVPFAGWSSWAFMQFTDKASVPGISGPCDADAFSGTLATLQALAGGPVTIPAPTIPEGTDMTYFINSTNDIDYWAVSALGKRHVISIFEVQAWEALGNAHGKMAASTLDTIPTIPTWLTGAPPAAATVDVQALAAAVVAALPAAPAGSLTGADVEAAVRAVLHGA